MSTIYEKAHLVIAAFSSSSATQGFLGHRKQQQTYHMRLPDRYGTNISIAARASLQTGFHSPDFFKEADPLAQRAWAFQEQHMSTRCLIFSADELQWVCKTKVACECGMTATPPLCYPLLLAYCEDDDVNQKQQQGEEEKDTSSSSGRLLALQDVWRKAVSEYSCRRLTQASDKLPAFSGLASRFADRMGSRYVAGLWRENIIQELGWARVSWFDELSTVAPLPTAYRAPSFSWASIDDRVWFWFGYYRQQRCFIPCCSVSDAVAVVPGHNPFGRVSDAWVTIQGPMVRGFMEPDNTLFKFYSDDWKISPHLELDCAVTVFSYAAQGGNDNGRSVRRYRSPQPSGEIPGDDDTYLHVFEPGRANEGMHLELAQASVWVLHLGRWARDKGESQSGDIAHDYYLVLGKSPRDPLKYERIGVCNNLSEEPLSKHTVAFTTRTITIL